jgi:hypothetical protein
MLMALLTPLSRRIERRELRDSAAADPAGDTAA